LERPLLRRRPMTARPPRVRIRIRKPWVFLRFRLFGWNVLFTHGLLGAPGAEAWGPGGDERSADSVSAVDWRCLRAQVDRAVYADRRPTTNAPRAWQRLLVALSTAR
jgi:hypothetical protein